ncbi:hypothetical protein [Hymenobacter sp. AT01-02]|uniref:hypothetical protein n=1 Tax=Hymenobacter sp. AT01-02 TaxID=1571877 RepID=UPI0005F21C5A|nr:hypothetical protein [Hymenobacter sp. AT01-02]
MQLLAYRPEYRIYLDRVHNHIVYERLEVQTLVHHMPHFLPDWQRVLAQVEPGFTMLLDVTNTLGPNLQLVPLYLRLRQLFRQAGVGVIAEVLPTNHNMGQLSKLLNQLQFLPVYRFAERAAAEQFLASYSRPYIAAAC